MDRNVVAEPLLQCVQRVARQLDLVLAHVVHPDGGEVVDGCTESDDFDDRRRARLELPRDLFGRPAVEAHVEDHLAATEERRHRVEDLLTRPQHADARRPAHLVAGEAEEVAPERLHVGRDVGHVLRGVDEAQSAGRVRGVGQLADGRDRAEHVGQRGEREQLGAVELLVEIAEVELVVVGESEPPQLDAALFLEHQPRDDVGVVLHLGEHDDVTFVQVGSSPRIGNQVDRFGDVLREHDVARRR